MAWSKAEKGGLDKDVMANPWQNNETCQTVCLRSGLRRIKNTTSIILIECAISGCEPEASNVTGVQIK